MMRDTSRPTPTEDMTDTPDKPAAYVDGAPSSLADQVDSNAGQVDGTPVNLDDSLSVSEAAAHFSVSERTIRRRIKDGSLTGSKLPTTQGYEWRVHLDGASDQIDSVSTRHPVNLDGSNVHLPGTSSPHAEQVDPIIARALDLIERMHEDQTEELERLRRDNQQLAGQVGFLQAKLQDAQEENQQLRLLMAPKDEPPVESEAPAVSEPVRSWWQRLLGNK